MYVLQQITVAVVAIRLNCQKWFTLSEVILKRNSPEYLILATFEMRIRKGLADDSSLLEYQALSPFETSVATIPTRRNIPEELYLLLYFW